MIVRLAEIERDVRRILDENRCTELLLDSADPETLDLQEQIRAKVEDAARIVESVAPLEFVNGEGERLTLKSKDGVRWLNDTSGWIVLPSDFLRLLKFSMSDWARPVYLPAKEGSLEHRLMLHRQPGIAGTPLRPRVAIVTRGVGLTLEFAGCSSRSATITDDLYLAVPRLDGEDGIELCGKCRRSVMYMTAALTAMAYGEMEKGRVMQGIALSLINLDAGKPAEQ